jgi:hypothetical protein
VAQFQATIGLIEVKRDHIGLQCPSCANLEGGDGEYSGWWWWLCSPGTPLCSPLAGSVAMIMTDVFRKN